MCCCSQQQISLVSANRYSKIKIDQNYCFFWHWPGPFIHGLENLFISGHHHYQCVFQIWEQCIRCILSYYIHAIDRAGNRQRAASKWNHDIPDPMNTEDIITQPYQVSWWDTHLVTQLEYKQKSLNMSNGISRHLNPPPHKMLPKNNF